MSRFTQYCCNKKYITRRPYLRHRAEQHGETVAFVDYKAMRNVAKREERQAHRKRVMTEYPPLVRYAKQGAVKTKKKGGK